jgi:hypothetical protein
MLVIATGYETRGKCPFRAIEERLPCRKSAGRFPGPRDFDLLTESSLALYPFEEALGLRLALDLLDELILVALIKRSHTAEHLRDNRRKILGSRLVDETAELRIGLIKDHISLLSRVHPRNRSNGFEADTFSGLVVRNDRSVRQQASGRATHMC